MGFVDARRMLSTEIVDKRIVLVLPWPPSVNHYKRVGRTIRTKRGKIYQQRIDTPETQLFYWEVFNRVRKQLGTSHRAALGDISATITLYPPDGRVRDIDGPIKALFDSLTRSQVIGDDSQIKRLFVHMREKVKGGMVKVRLRAIA